MAPFSCAIFAISLIGLIVPITFEAIAIETIFVFGVIVSRTFSNESVPSASSSI